MQTLKRAAVVSDLHLGEESSLLRSDENIARFTDKLKDIGELDEIIIAGDFMDFSLASLNEAYNNAQRFLAAVGDLPNIRRIVYVPGNHDHHLWFQLVEQEELIRKLKRAELPISEDKYINMFVDRSFPTKNGDTFLGPLLTQCECQCKLIIKYPHHLRAFNGKYYLFTHGHFLQDVFTPVNIVLEPGFLAELEAFNCLWLEALWYHIGQSGRLGDLVERMYDDFKAGRDTEICGVVDTAVDVLRKRGHISMPLAWIIKRYIRYKLKRLFLHEHPAVSSMRGSAITPDLQERIEQYIRKYILQRYTRESDGEPIPTPFNFVFGHTHNYDVKTCEIDGKTYTLINTGGWLKEDQKTGKNAGILVIDESRDGQYDWQAFE